MPIWVTTIDGKSHKVSDDTVTLEALIDREGGWVTVDPPSGTDATESYVHLRHVISVYDKPESPLLG